MSVISLAGLRGNKGLAKGVNKVNPDVNISPAAGSLLYSSSAPSISGASTDVNITAVAGALLYSSSAPTITAGGGTAGESIGLLLALTKAA